MEDDNLQVSRAPQHLVATECRQTNVDEEKHNSEKSNHKKIESYQVGANPKDYVQRSIFYFI